LDNLVVGIFLLTLNSALVEAEQHGNDLWREEVGVYHLLKIDFEFCIFKL